MFTRPPVNASDRDRSENPGMMSLAPVFAPLGRAGKKITLKIHKKSCSVRYKDLFRAKNTFGVIGTLNGTHARLSSVDVTGI